MTRPVLGSPPPAALLGPVHRKPTKHHAPNALPDNTWLEVYSLIPADNLNFRARFGDGGDSGIKETGGGGGWESVRRPKKRALTVWRGPDQAYQYEIPLIFDGWSNGKSVEDEIRTLKRMAGVNVKGDPKPPFLILNANGTLDEDVFHKPSNRWVIPSTPDFGIALRHAEGYRTRQFVTVTFMLVTTDDQLTRDQQVSKTKFTTARAGDTYNKIAARTLKEWGGLRWGNRLAQLNGARDGASSVKAGQQVKLPTEKQIQDWKRKPRR